MRSSTARSGAERRSSTAKILGALLLCAALTGVCHQGTLSRRDRFAPEEDILYLPKPSALRVMSLGHHEMAATLVFVRALVYFGGEIATQDKRFTWLENYLQTIVSLDPYFELPYRWAGSALMYNGKQITNEVVERSNGFLKQGAEHFPKSWQFPWMIGCNYLFELHTDDPQRKAEWERIGGDWLRQAALLGSAPPWASLLAAQIMGKEGRQEAAVKYLEEIYMTTNDERAKEEIRNRMIALRRAADAEGMDKKAKEFTSGWRAVIPYAHPDYYVLLGSPPSPRLDPEWLSRDQVLIEAQRAEEAMRSERRDSRAAGN